jgi:hypothetical protein
MNDEERQFQRNTGWRQFQHGQRFELKMAVQYDSCDGPPEVRAIGTVKSGTWILCLSAELAGMCWTATAHYSIEQQIKCSNSPLDQLVCEAHG